MSGKGKRSKVKVQGAKPELPPFLQAMKQQIVANEDAERKERSLRKRKEMSKSGTTSRGGGGGGGGDSDDNEPSVVKLDDNDLTEEEYKKMKRDLETKYKLDQDTSSQREHVELDIDKMIEQRSSIGSNNIISNKSKAQDRPTSSRPSVASGQSSSRRSSKGDAKGKQAKKLSYSSSSSSEADD